jgi:cation-transporting P-type ATPase 13A2
MCGDGANDCGALKQADIGLSLSPAEASISAPFTSQVTNISAMVELIKECRAGLATNFSLFNIMATYALTQYVVTTISEIFYSYPGQYQYMYWDLACNLLFIIFIGYTDTADRLSVARPSNSLFCFSNLFQVLFAFVLVVIGQISMILSLSGLFSSTIDYPNVGGFEVNLALLIELGDRPSDTP